MVSCGVHTLPLVDEHGMLLGMVDEATLARELLRARAIQRTIGLAGGH
jgi:CBS-domain-containing membrane protein